VREDFGLSGSSEVGHLKAAVNWALLIAVSLALVSCVPGPAPQAVATPKMPLPEEYAAIVRIEYKGR
jgi:hypothetical protein